MPRKLNHEAGQKVVRRTARTLPTQTDRRMAELRRLVDRADSEIGASDVPVQDPSDGRWVRGGHRVGGIRGAIILEMGRRGLTRYQLWKLAREHCPTLPNSAVYEYLDGRRQVGGSYIEAMLEALSLVIRPKLTA